MTRQEYRNRMHTYAALAVLGIGYDAAETLRRASMTLHRWAEGECGDSNAYASWCIERDETTGKPYRVTYPHQGKTRRESIPDREAGALRRIAALLTPLGLHYWGTRATLGDVRCTWPRSR